MNPLERRRLGRTEVTVTPMGLGGAPLGDLFEVIPEPQGEATILTALDAGIGYVDTAPWYGRGRSEHRFGHVLSSIPRERFVISTKVGRILRRPSSLPFSADRWVGGLPFEVEFDYSYDGIMRSYEDSLQRLGLPRVDILLIHDLEPNYFPDPADMNSHLDALDRGGGMKALLELKAAGEIGAIGAGVNLEGTISRYLDRQFPLDAFLVAMPYTLLDQPVLDKEFPICAERGIGIVIGAVFASGILATGSKPGALWHYQPAAEPVLQKVAKIEAVCARHDVPLRAAALQFPLLHPIVAAIIPGANRPSMVHENLALLRHAIPPAFWAELKAEKLLHPDAPVAV